MRLTSGSYVEGICVLQQASFYYWARPGRSLRRSLPGQDMLGSDRSLHRRGVPVRSNRHQSRWANTQIGGYSGDTSGVVTVPGVQTTGTDSRTNLQNASEAGQSTQAGALAARRSAAELVAQNRANASGDNGSVWNANTVRKQRRRRNRGCVRSAEIVVGSGVCDCAFVRFG